MVVILVSGVYRGAGARNQNYLPFLLCYWEISQGADSIWILLLQLFIGNKIFQNKNSGHAHSEGFNGLI